MTGPTKRKPRFLEILRERFGERRVGRDVSHRLAASDDRLATDEAPQIGVEAAVGLAQSQGGLGVAAEGPHLGAVADDAHVGQQHCLALVGIGRDTCGVETFVGLAVALAPVEDR